MKKAAVLATLLALIFCAFPASAEPRSGGRADQVMDEIGRKIGVYAEEIQKEVSEGLVSFLDSLNWDSISRSTGDLADQLGALFSSALEEMKMELEKALVKGLQDAAADLRGKGLWQNGLASALDSVAAKLGGAEPADAPHVPGTAEQESPSPRENPGIRPDKLIPQPE